MSSESHDNQLWVDFCMAEDAFYNARMALLRGAQDLSSIIREALKIPSQRGPVLRLLQILPEERIREHLACLVDLASVGQSDIALCRSAILRIERDWLLENIDLSVSEILKSGDEEEYRRIAELYVLLDSELLDAHLKRCATHENDAVKEIASDFAHHKVDGRDLDNSAHGGNK